VTQKSKMVPFELAWGFLFAFHSNYGFILYHFRDKARYWSKSRFFILPCIWRPHERRNIATSFGMKNQNGVATQWWKVWYV